MLSQQICMFDSTSFKALVRTESGGRLGILTHQAPVAHVARFSTPGVAMNPEAIAAYISKLSPAERADLQFLTEFNGNAPLQQTPIQASANAPAFVMCGGSARSGFA